MDADEREICNYLKSWSGQFVYWRDIARHAAGKWRYRDDPDWAGPVLARLVERGILESDAFGNYRLHCAEKEPLTKWLSPQIQSILQQSGRNWGGVMKRETPEGFHDRI
jgi:hypothetical protein